jgi:hypothetical protein
MDKKYDMYLHEGMSKETQTKIRQEIKKMASEMKKSAKLAL